MLISASQSCLEDAGKRVRLVPEQSLLSKSCKLFTFLGLIYSLKCVQFHRFNFDSQWMAIR